MTQTRKLRIDREWWAETLKPFETKNKKIEELEDTELHMELLKRPFPKTKAEFKGHPLYVLEGDLLKFEAIYPESAAILGYVGEKSSKQAIYSRECVHIVSFLNLYYFQSFILSCYCINNMFTLSS